MTATAAQVREASLWVQHYAAQAERLRDRTAAAGEQQVSSFHAWYSVAAVAALAASLAAASQVAQHIAAGLSGQFVANLGSLATGKTGTFPRKAQPLVIRNGTPLNLVYTRPAETYRRAIALGATPQTARQRAAVRATALLRNDVVLVERQQAQRTLERMGIKEYRRIIHPELSASGSCGLCVAASDRVYKTGQLMPIHPPNCKCTVMPVVGSWDPGISLNRSDLERLYGDAGSAAAKDLKRTRYAVKTHGEFGPVLVKDDDSFRGPQRVALENDPQRARRMLARAIPVLQRMEADRGPRDALAYQRDLVARLQRVPGAA